MQRAVAFGATDPSAEAVAQGTAEALVLVLAAGSWRTAETSLVRVAAQQGAVRSGSRSGSLGDQGSGDCGVGDTGDGGRLNGWARAVEGVRD